MSIEQIGEKEFARRNFFEATLYDEKHNPLVWSTGLIKSINIPKISFTTEDIYAGTNKGYLGWKLPDNISLSIWETSDHQVEKYLDDWMLGKNGVFDPENSIFRAHDTEDNIYRDLRVKTFIYKYTEGSSYQAKKMDVVTALYLTLKSGLTEQIGPVTIEQQEYIQAISEMAVTEVEKRIESQENSITIKEKVNANENNIGFVKQNTQMQKIAVVEQKQIAPIVGNLVAAVNGLLGNAVPRIPILPSDLTRKFTPPVIIPPPLIRVPIPTGTPFPQVAVTLGKPIQLQDRISPITRSKEIRYHDNISGSSNDHRLTIRDSTPEKKSKNLLTIIDGIEKKAEEILIDFAEGAAVNAKRWKATEKTTSLIKYETAIENYDIGGYDYSTGDGVSYTVNLAVRDIKIEHPT